MIRVPTLAAGVIATICAGCASAPALSPRYQPTFDYQPPETAGSTEGDAITVALLQPQYPYDADWAKAGPDFARRMQQDLEELLTARGLTVMGPFSSYDEMVYQEKEGSDLLLTPILEVDGGLTDAQWRSEYKIRIGGASGNVYQIERGSIGLGGSVTLAVAEPFTQERLWNPSIELAQSSQVFVGEAEYIEETQRPDEPAVLNAYARALEDIYGQVMSRVWEQLDPNQLAVLRDQSAEIRERAGYIR